MSDIGKAFGLAVLMVAIYAMSVMQAAWYLRPVWHVVVYGPVGAAWPGVTNLGWFGILLGCLTMSLTMLLLLLFRRVGRRESGGMILETERGIRRGTMPGAERLRGELE